MNCHDNSSLKSIEWRLFSFNHPSTNEQGDEEVISVERAITVLVNYLKDEKGALDDLEQALNNPGCPSNCVIIRITKEMICELQEEIPHVVYCRIWRWPHLMSQYEIKSSDICANPYSEGCSTVCINPYHYTIKKHQILPPIFVPKQCKFKTQSMTNLLIPDYNPMPTKTPMNMMYTDQRTFIVDNHYCKVPITRSSQQIVIVRTMDPTSRPTYNDDVTLVNYEEANPWATIVCHEFNRRIGEKFTCTSHTLIIGGFTNTNQTNRLSICHLKNVQSSKFVETAKVDVGKGIRLIYAAGSLYVECLSDHPIFVQSTVGNIMNNLEPDTVVKIQSGFNLKIFSATKFAEILSESVHRGLEEVTNLRKACVIRISFLKGWGSSYNRLEITSIPCWIEVELHGPLNWVDRVLAQMNGSMDNVKFA